VLIGSLPRGQVLLFLAIALVLGHAPAGCLGHPRRHHRRGVTLRIVVSGSLKLVPVLLQTLGMHQTTP
jgi:hypothetical protein